MKTAPIITYGAVLKMMRRGMDTVDIAKRLGVPEATIWNVLKRGDE